MKRILLLAALFALSGALWAQKNPLDHDVYDSWQAVSGTVLSPSGKVISYAVNPQEGDGTLFIRMTEKKGARTLEIPRGYQVRLTDNDRYAVCLIKPEFQKTRRARIKKLTGNKLPQDSLAVIDLTSGTITRKFPNVKSFQMGLHATEQFAFSTVDTAFVKKADKDQGTTVAVYRFVDGKLDTLRRIDKFAFSKDGRTLGLIQKTDKKHSVVGFYADGKARMFTDTATFHAVPVFNEEGTEALYLQAKDTASTGSKHAALWLYDIVRDEARELVAADQRRNMPENWGLTENSSYRFSKRLGSIYAGIQEYVPVKDTNLVSFETAGLDIWTWDADEIPPRMKANLTRDKQRTFPCLYQDEGLIPFNTNKADRLIFTDNYDADVILEVSPVNTIESQWNTQGESVLTLIFPGSGRRVEIARGAYESVQLSPKGKYAIWWDYKERAWFVYDVAAEEIRNLTGGIDTNFWDERDDHPMLPESYGIAAWTRDDESVILNDRYDLWRIQLSDGKAGRLTQGREQKRTYRYISTKDSEDDPGIGPGETIYLRVFDEVTKENGLASYQVDPKKLNFKTLAFGGYTWDGLRKAKNAPVFAYQKGNLQEQMDLYVTDFGKSTEKLTAINPQQKDYNWATVELYHWTTFDGKTMDGLLYKPEDFDPERTCSSMRPGVTSCSSRTSSIRRACRASRPTTAL